MILRHNGAMQGQLWIVDGVDGVGKATQAALLVERLNLSRLLKKHRAEQRFFPNYQEKPWGVLTRQYLDGAFGALESVGPYAASLLYAGDRGNHADEMRETLGKGNWIVCDRYVSSNAAFQSAKIESEPEKQRYIAWLSDTEFNLFGIPKPTGVIVLTLPVHISHRRTEARRNEAKAAGEILNDKVGHQDIHEQNRDYMERAMVEYVKMARTYGWHVVSCAEGERELTRQEVSDKIWEVVSKQLN